MALFRAKPVKWLVVFVNKDDEEAFLSEIRRLEESFKPTKPIKENVETCTLNGDSRKKLKDIKPGSLSASIEEVRESFSNALINTVLTKKRDTKSHKVAVVLTSNLFSSEEAFGEVVCDPIFDDNKYFAICSRRNFLDMERKLSHLQTSCRDCSDFLCNESQDGCKHSCLPRLLWLVFDKDVRIKDELLSSYQKLEQP